MSRSPSKKPNAASTGAPPMSRRRALAKLGIAAGVAYVAPTIVKLDRTANAKVLPSPCPPPWRQSTFKGSLPPWCR